MTEAKQNKDQNFAALSAMLKAGLKPKPKLGAIEYARRLVVEKALQQRRYCDAFALWRTLSAQGVPPAAPLRRRSGSMPAPRARPRAACAAVAGAAGHHRVNAAQYRRAGARGAAMHAAGFV